MFKYVDITSTGCEGWINLFFGDQCICMISDPELATDIKKSINNIVHEKLDGLMWMVEDVPSSEVADRISVSFTESNQPRTCRFWDCGFCYHDDGPKDGECVGIGECQIWEER